MNKYKLRPAKIEDIPFLATAVIEGEKGVSNKCSFSTLFNLPEEKVKEYIIAMFEEEIDGCEFSLSSYFVITYDNEPVASYSGWIECFGGQLPSKVLKANLINYIFSEESIAFLKTKAHIIKDLTFERTCGVLQLEYLYVTEPHRGNRLPSILTTAIEENAKLLYPELLKSEGQLFGNHQAVVNILAKHGYEVIRSILASNDEVQKYLPFNKKLVIEKIF